MHFITFLKSTGEIVDYRMDNSEPAYWTEHSLKKCVSKDREIAEENLETKSFSELPPKENNFSEPLNLRQHAFDVATGKLKNNPNYVAPPVEKRISLQDVVSNLTLAEKSKLINNLTPSVVTAKEEFKQPRNIADATEILQFLVDSGDISAESMSKILA